jgi:hypothetical protein
LSVKLVAAAFAFVLFVIAAFVSVPSPRVNLGWLGAAFLTVAIALP